MKNIFFVGRISWHCRGVWSVFISWKPRFNPCCAVQPQGEIMPSLCAKLAENGGSGRSAAAPSPPPESSLNQALALVEKKVRNLEKRKVCPLNFTMCFVIYVCLFSMGVLKQAWSIAVWYHIQYTTWFNSTIQITINN